MVIAEEYEFDAQEVHALYDSVGWEGYTADVDKLCRGLRNAHLVLTARDDAGALLGLSGGSSRARDASYGTSLRCRIARVRQVRAAMLRLAMHRT